MNIARPHGTDAAATRTGGQVLIDTLIAQGADLAFCVPGESYLAALDAMHDVQDKFRLIVCRHEASATNMAEATGKLTGRPGICFVTRGPGSSHAAIGIHTAQQDSTPLIVFVGQVSWRPWARGLPGGRLCPDVRQVRQMGRADRRRRPHPGDRQPRLPCRRQRPARSRRGRHPGGCAEGSLPEPPAPRFNRAIAAPSRAALAELETLIAAAERPLLMLGGGGWDAEAVKQMQTFAEKHHLAATVGFRCQDLFDNTHPNYVGDLGLGIDAALVDMVKKADLLIVVGERLGDASTKGYTLIDIPQPGAEAGPRPSQAGAIGHGLSGRSADRGDRARFRRSRRGHQAGAEDPGGLDRRRSGRLRQEDHAEADRTGAGCGAGGEISARDAAGRRHHHQRRRHLYRLCAPLLHLPDASRPSWRRPAAPWATASRRRSRPRWSIPTDR